MVLIHWCLPKQDHEFLVKKSIINILIEDLHYGLSSKKDLDHGVEEVIVFGCKIWEDKKVLGILNPGRKLKIFWKS